ncbi:MAG: ATP-binding protein [Anaerolineales bacterium]|nr:ATP-binding protein [Anaerolineales bacterium]
MDGSSRLKIEADLKRLARIRAFIENAASSQGADKQTVDDMLLAANEAVTNIILHGYQGQPGMIEIEVSCQASDLVVRLRDQAPHFDPLSFPEPDTELPLDQRPFGQMGIHVLRNFTDRLSYRITQDGSNELTLIKHNARKRIGD